VAEDGAGGWVVGKEGEDAHVGAAVGAEEGEDLVDAGEEASPAGAAAARAGSSLRTARSSWLSRSGSATRSIAKFFPRVIGEAEDDALSTIRERR